VPVPVGAAPPAVRGRGRPKGSYKVKITLETLEGGRGSRRMCKSGK
jgi:hypothetical protein